MKLAFRLILSLLIALVLVVSVFTFLRTKAEEKKLSEDLGLRTTVLAKSFKGAIENYLDYTDQPERIRKFVAKFEGHKRLVGILVSLVSGTVVALPDRLTENGVLSSELQHAVDSAEIVQLNTQWDGRPVNFYAVPLEKDGKVVGGLGLVHDRRYIVSRLEEFVRETAMTFTILAVLLSLTAFVLIRVSITMPLSKIASWVNRSRTSGNDDEPRTDRLRKMGEIERLAYEVNHLASSLRRARAQSSRSGAGQSPFDLVWTRETLKTYLKDRLKGKRLFVVANREPYMHRRRDGKLECIVPASGVVTALDPVLQVTGGMWVAHGSGEADREVVDKKDKVQVPPWAPSYSLKRVWLSPEEEKGYYYGFSNEGLWPLCHISHTRPVFRVTDWGEYQRVNRKFAEALLKELPRESSFVLVQDYHFALLPRMIKEKRPDTKVALFWHIPWPNPEAYGICPWQKEILEGMLGSDLIGFHTQYHCNNFLETVDRFLESRIDWNVFGVTRSGHMSYVKPFPISVATEHEIVEEAALKARLDALRSRYGLHDKKVGVGVDRIDYTKGLLERFRAIDRFLEKYPAFKQKFVFVELGAPSRTLIESYSHHLDEVKKLADQINAKHATSDWSPILFLIEHHGQAEIRDFYRLADFCLVTSLHDGMNLVAKEYVLEKDGDDGVLILSHFAGASYQMTSALLVNPYDIENTADSIERALTMPSEERVERMRQLRSLVREHNIYRWAAELVTELIRAF